MAKILHTRDKAKADTIAALAIRFAAMAVDHLDADEIDLRIQIAHALLKSTEMPLLREKFFEPGDGSLVSKLFADGTPIPDPEGNGYDLV